jgi:hypothetical protein
MSYEYDIQWESRTSQVISGRALVEAGTGPEELAVLFEEELRLDLPGQLRTEFAKEGYELSSVEVLEVYSWYTSELKDPRMPITENRYRLHAKCKVHIVTTKPFETSPLDPITWVLIIKVLDIVLKAIVLILIAYFVAKLIESFLLSMVTTKTRIVRYDEQGNIVYEEEKTESSLGGISIVGIVFIIIILIALFWMFGGPKRR